MWQAAVKHRGITGLFKNEPDSKHQPGLNNGRGEKECGLFAFFMMRARIGGNWLKRCPNRSGFCS